MSNNDDDNNKDVVNLNDHKINRNKKINTNKIDEDDVSPLETGMHHLADILENTDISGIVAIVFDKEDQPTIVQAGDLDFVKAMGTLEIIKGEMLHNVYKNQIHPKFSDQPFEFVPEDLD